MKKSKLRQRDSFVGNNGSDHPTRSVIGVLKVAALCVVVVGLLGCWPSSDNAVDCPPSNIVNAGAYLGEWRLVWWGDDNQLTNSPVRLTVFLNGAGETQYAVRDSSGAFTNSVQLTSVGSLTVASATQASGWDMFSVTIISNGQRLAIGVLRSTIVSNHITSGVVSGQVINVDSDDSVIRLKASGPQLRNYISAHPEVFQEAFVFQKDE